MFTKLMGLDLNPIHWALLGCLIFSLILGVAYWKQSQDLKVCSAEFSSFTSKTETAGLESKLRTLSLIRDNTRLSKLLEDQSNEAKARSKSDYDKYADQLRRYKASAGKVGEAPLSAPSSQLTCPNYEARLSESLGRLEEGILERLAKSRDEAIGRTIICKAYLEEQENLYKSLE